MKRENIILKRGGDFQYGDPRFKEGYISSPQSNLRPIDEVETESNEIAFDHNQDDLGTDLSQYDVEKLRDNIESYKRLRKNKRYSKHKASKTGSGLNSAPNDKESQAKSNFLVSHMPTVPEFNHDPPDPDHDLDYEKNQGYFSNGSSHTKDY